MKRKKIRVSYSYRIITANIIPHFPTHFFAHPLTRGKMTELLLVLEHPELPLHNNPAELAARTMVQRRHISYGTQTKLGTKAWDTFMSLVDTTRKLGISFFEYVSDRISEARNIPPLATIIEEKSLLHFWGESWQV